MCNRSKWWSDDILHSKDPRMWCYNVLSIQHHNWYCAPKSTLKLCWLFRSFGCQLEVVCEVDRIQNGELPLQQHPYFKHCCPPKAVWFSWYSNSDDWLCTTHGQDVYPSYETGQTWIETTTWLMSGNTIGKCNWEFSQFNIEIKDG